MLDDNQPVKKSTHKNLKTSSTVTLMNPNKVIIVTFPEW